MISWRRVSPHSHCPSIITEKYSRAGRADFLKFWHLFLLYIKIQMQNYHQIKIVKILSGNIVMFDFYEHLQHCRAIIMKSEHSRKHQIIFVHCFNISHVFKECDFSNIIKMIISTTAKEKNPTLTKWKAKLHVSIFFCWKWDGNWSITQAHFCFDRIIFLF